MNNLKHDDNTNTMIKSSSDASAMVEVYSRRSPNGSEGSVVSNANKLLPKDFPAHRWYRFVLSYPPHLVRHYIEKFNVDNKQLILDPFCGTGTTLVECKKQGISSIGIEAIPMTHFASSVKTSRLPVLIIRVYNSGLEGVLGSGGFDSRSNTWWS